MAGSRFYTLLSFLSLALSAFAVPSTRDTTSSCGYSKDVVKFTIDLTWDDFAPTGGISRKAILTNGTVPGPALTMNVGQTVEFTVINNLPNVTAIHFHGISQKNTPWSDGVPGLTQEPIPAGETYTYKWTADEAGAYFYHAHYKGQMMDGLYGAIIIQAADSDERPFKLISNDSSEVKKMVAAEKEIEPVFISDWSQFTFEEFHQIEKDVNIDDACADSILLNGMGSEVCLSRDEITAYTSPKIAPLLAAVQPSQLTNKGCLPPNLPATQGNFTFNLAALPANAYFTCNPSTGKSYTHTVDPASGWAALTFINSGGFSSLKFTIDNHKLYVFGVNGRYVVPQVVDQVIVNNGDRYSILVKLDQAVGSYQIRVANNGLNQIISGYGVLQYKGSSGPAAGAFAAMNVAGGNTTILTAFSDKFAYPFPAIAPGASSAATYIMNIKKPGRPLGAYEWTLSGINGYNMSTDDQAPLLFQDPSTIQTSDTVIKTPADSWVDIIIKVVGPLAQPHPMHKHANKVFVLGQGIGAFNYSTVAEAAAVMPIGTFNFVNPPYRDTFTTTPAEGNSSWLALRYKTDHPGAWIFHCHMQTHFSGGMAVALLDGSAKFPQIQASYDTCTDYTVATNGTSGSGSGSSSGSSTSSGSGKGTATNGTAVATTSVAAFTGAASVQFVASSSVVISAFALIAAAFGL